MAEVAQKNQRKNPAWMSVGGAPERPNFDEFHRRKNGLIDKRKKLIEEVKKLQEELNQDKANDGTEELRNAFKERLDEIDRLTTVEKEKRTKKNEEVAALRVDKQELSNKARQHAKQTGCFTSVSEVDACIEYLMEKMETSCKSASVMQKETEAKVKELRKVRALLSETRTEDEQLKVIKSKEDNIKRETFEIQERIKELAAQREAIVKERQEKTGVGKERAAQRSAKFQKIQELRTQITEVSAQLDEVFDSHKASVATWDAWCEEAKKKYEAQREARRLESEKEFQELQREEKLKRAQQRQNPYKVEISVCEELMQYLVDRKKMALREKEQRERMEAAAHFDPTSSVPEGCVVINEGEWSSSKNAKKAKKGAEVKKSGATKKNTSRIIQHNEGKLKKFQLVGVEPPLSLEEMDTAVTALEKKKKELEANIRNTEACLSSDHDEDDAEDHEEAHEAKENSSATESPSKDEEEQNVNHNEGPVANEEAAATSEEAQEEIATGEKNADDAAAAEEKAETQEESESNEAAEVPKETTEAAEEEAEPPKEETLA